jgi:hypothetical protein
MALSSRAGCLIAVTLSLAMIGPTSSATPPIWENELGAPIAGITDTDDAATKVPMGTFSFPFYGVTHASPDTLGVSSNGLIEFNTENESNVPSGGAARTGEPKIAALWADLNPSNLPPDQGTVWMNTFNDDADPAIDRVVFTWDSAFFGCENRPTCRARAQVQLFESGKIVFGYDGVLTNQALDEFGGIPLMPVIAKGGFVAPPEARFVPEPPGVDFSQMVPFDGGELIFEEFTGRPIHFDLDQNNLIFEPNGPGGYHVTSSMPFSVLPTGSGSPPVATDTTPPNVKVKVGRQSLEKVLSKGLRLQVQCDEACFAEIEVGSKRPKVKMAGTASVELGRSGSRSVSVKLNRAAHHGLAGVSKAILKVTVAAFDESENKSTIKKTVRAK